MTRILRCESFASKDMAEVPATGGAHDLSADAVSIRLPFNGAFDLIVEAGPATPGFEFRGGFVKSRSATLADIGSIFIMIVVFAGKRSFGPFAEDDPFFLWCEFFQRFLLSIKRHFSDVDIGFEFLFNSDNPKTSQCGGIQRITFSKVPQVNKIKFRLIQAF